MADDDRENGLLIAGTIAPIVGAAWGAISLVSFGVVTSGAWQWEALAALPLYVGAVWLYGSVVAILLTWTLGLLWHAWAMASGWRNRSAYLAAGATIGFWLAIIFTLTVLRSAVQSYQWLLVVAWWTSCSMVVAWMGWSIRRPDRDAPNLPTAAP